MARCNKIILLMLVTCSAVSCQNAFPEKPAQAVYLFKDKDGLYQYLFATGKEKLIYKLQDWQVFLDEPYKISGDTLTIGLVGQEANSQKDMGINYSNYYISIDLKTGKNRESREIQYTTDYAHKQLTIKTIDIDSESRQKTISDTTMPYQGGVYWYRGRSFNDGTGLFYSEHTVGNKTVYSESGNLYYTKLTEDGGSETDWLVMNQGLDPKFGNGFLQPQFDPTGTYVIGTFIPGFLKKPAALYKITIADKKMQVIKEGQFINPRFSADGKFVLFSRNAEMNQKEAFESEVYILNLQTLEETKIGNASFAQWDQK